MTPLAAAVITIVAMTVTVTALLDPTMVPVATVVQVMLVVSMAMMGVYPTWFQILTTITMVVPWLQKSAQQQQLGRHRIVDIGVRLGAAGQQATAKQNGQRKAFDGL